MAVFHGSECIVDSEIIWPDCAFLVAIGYHMDVKSANHPCDPAFCGKSIGRVGRLPSMRPPP
jgi:hypothetical protein